jgi:hypothetical protein
MLASGSGRSEAVSVALVTPFLLSKTNQDFFRKTRTGNLCPIQIRTEIGLHDQFFVLLLQIF